MAAFIGRSGEIARLAALDRGLVTLWGPGGVGKTRLAREHAARERAGGRTVVWADLAGARTRDEAVAALAGALGVALGKGDDPEAALARAADAQRALVIADNLEQLDARARAAVAHLGGGHAMVLATSRELLGAPGEIAIAISPLDEDEGVRLFESLVDRSASGGADRALVRAIVKRLDSLPLGIELAAARMPLLGAEELLARLDRKLDVLGTARDDRPARHATLRAAIAWSWDLLDEGEREALATCATFEGTFDAALVEAAMEEGGEAASLDRLERLRARALIHASADDRGRPLLRLLESVRDFAREAKAGDASAQARWARHAAAVVARSEPLAEAARCGKDVAVDLERLRADLAAASRRGGALAPRAVIALSALLAITGPPDAAVEIIDAATTEDAVLAARLRVAKGDALRALGRLGDARDVLLRVRNLPDGREARIVAGDASRVLGSVLRSLGHGKEALAAKESALAIYRAEGDRGREGICLGEIGAVHQSEGRLALARRFHAEAIAIHTATGARRAEGTERSFLAVATHRAGDPAAAIAIHEQALAIHREVGHRRLEGAELLHLAFVHHELGAVASARDAFASARAVLATAGARGLEALALVLAARLEVDAGDPTTALLRLADASQIAPPTWPRIEATRQLVEGHLALASSDAARAASAFEASLSTSRDVEVGFEALTPAYLALAKARAGKAPRATLLAHLEDARARLADHENPHLGVAVEILSAAARGAPPPSIPDRAAATSSEVRRALAFAGTRRALTIDDAGRRVLLPDGRAIDLSRRKSVRQVLLALARARRDSPGVPVPPSALLAAGWPDERMRPDAAMKRLHTAIWTLRSLGLETLLLTDADAYLLDPGTDLLLP